MNCNPEPTIWQEISFSVIVIALICWVLNGCSTQNRISTEEKIEVHTQANAVSRIMDARCDDPIKITEKQCVYLLNKESAWERGEITRAKYEAEERRIIPPIKQDSAESVSPLKAEEGN